MQSIQLGKSTLTTSSAALGCMRINKLDKKQLEDLIFAALEAGINLFDHADIYGGGECEKVFGNFLKIHPEVRAKIFVQSKCGIRTDVRAFDFSKKHIVKSAKDSLARLQCDYLDILALHRPDALFEPDEVAEAFDELYNQGLVRNFGVSNQNQFQIELLQNSLPLPLIVNQLQFGPAHTAMLDSAFNVNMSNPAAIERGAGTIEYCRLKNLTIQAWSPFLYGFFAGVIFNTKEYAKLTSTLTAIGAIHRISPEGCIVAWIRRHPANIQVLLGTTSPERIKKATAGCNVQLSREEWYEIYLAAGNSLP